MTDQAKHDLRKHGVAWVLAVLSLCLLIITHAPLEYEATRRIKLDFVSTNQISLTPSAYATNGSGWKPIRTEVAFIRSEIIVGKALERLDPGSTQIFGRSAAVTKTMDQLESSLVTQGIQLRAVGKDPQKTIELVNKIAEVYRDERNKLWSPPPGCRELSISQPNPAQLIHCRLYLPPLFRFTLATALLAIMVALRFAGKAPQLRHPFFRAWLYWFCLLFGLALLITPLSVAVVFAGATLFSMLLATAFGGVAWVMSQNPPVPPKLLAYTFAIACFIMMGHGVLTTIVWPEPSFATVRVRVSVEETGINGESTISYEPRFVATECEVIQSRPILGQIVDQLSLAETLSQKYGGHMNQRDALEMTSRSVRVRPVKNTSMIDIMHWNHIPGKQGRVAVDIAERYQSYCNERSKTNLTQRIKVTLLGSPDSPRSKAQKISGQCGHVLSEMLLSALFVLAGSLGSALLARNPVRLWLILISGVVYLGLLGVFAAASSLRSEAYTATALVRLWPMAKVAQSHQPDPIEALLLRQCELGTSVEVLSNVVQVLDANPSFMKQQRESWRAMDNPERQHWLKQRLEVVPAADTFLIRFEASADNPKDAAEIANAAATVYCSSRAGINEQTVDGRNREEVEILDHAVPALRPREASNPFAKGLTNGLSYVIWFLVGAGIAALGCLLETARRIKAAAPAR